MNKLYFICASFLLLFLPSQVFAPEEAAHDQRFEQVFVTELLPLDNSPYNMEFVAVTKNNDDDLVSVISGRVYAYLPHPILEDYLNKFPSEYVTVDAVDYKKWSVLILRTHNEEDAIHGSEFKADWCTWLIENVETRGNFLDLPQGFSCKPIDDVIVVIRAYHASIVVENGDTTDYYLTILRQLD